MKHLFTLLVLLLLISCKTDPPPPAAPETKPQEEKVKPQPQPDLETQRWNTFWDKFKVAVANDNAEAVADLTVFPLHGMEHYAGGQTMTREKFIINFAKIFDKETKETIAKTTSDMGDFSVKKQATADRLHVPVNTKVRSISVLYFHDKGTDNQTESSVIFHFAKIDDVYKLVSTMTAG